MYEKSIERQQFIYEGRRLSNYSNPTSVASALSRDLNECMTQGEGSALQPMISSTSIYYCPVTSTEGDSATVTYRNWLILLRLARTKSYELRISSKCSSNICPLLYLCPADFFSLFWPATYLRVHNWFNLVKTLKIPNAKCLLWLLIKAA